MSVKPFYRSRTLWFNLSTLPLAAVLTPFVGADVALKVFLVVSSVANVVLRLFFTDQPVRLL